MDKHEIKVGDIINYDPSVEFSNLLVTSIEGDRVHYKRLNRGIGMPLYDWMHIDSTIGKIVPSKGKIIGYKLLKDTPEYNTGTTFKLEDEVYIPVDTTYDNCIYYYDRKHVEKKPQFFEPIYEEVKPTSIVVKTTAGDVTVSKDKLTIISTGESIPTNIFSAIKYSIDSYKPVHLTSFGATKIETFKVGCKTFHVNDIPKLEEAIKQVL